ncbi:MAG: DUF4157 domain-containing protein [Opitutus sp.]
MATAKLRTEFPCVQRQEAPEKPREQPSKLPVEDPIKTGTEKDEAEKEKLVKAGLKAAGELATRFFDLFSSSAEGQKILSANERDWKPVMTFFEDFSKTVIGKLLLGAAAGGAAAGLAAGAWGGRDDPSSDPDVSPSTGGPVRRSPKDEKFFTLELKWDFVTPPTAMTLKTPWLDLPKIGKSSSSSPETPLLEPPPMFKSTPMIPRICTPSDPAGDRGEADARSAFIYGWLKHGAELEQKQARELLEKYGAGAKPMGPPKNAPSVLTPMFQAEEGMEALPDPAAVKTGLSSPSESLDQSTRLFMEERFGHDFGNVRIHAGTDAATSARAMGAKAYTVGRDVVFGEGHYSAASDRGIRLLTHELAHVVQQGAGEADPRSRLGFSRRADEAEADRVADAVSASVHAPALTNAEPSVARTGDPKAKAGPPTNLPTGQKVVIQWGDDPATVANARALATGARSGPNAAGARLLQMEDLTAESLVGVREVAIVIHGESDLNADGTRVIKEGETAPRAERGLVGTARGFEGPIQQVTPAQIAEKLRNAGFGGGRWTAYRVNLVMCYAGVGRNDSLASRLSGEMASAGVRTEVVGGMGRVTATGNSPTERVPEGQSSPKASARPQPGIPQVEKYYEPPNDTLLRRPGTGFQRVQAPAKPSAPTSGAPANASPITAASALPQTARKPVEAKADTSKPPTTASAQSAQTLGALAAVAEKYVKDGLQSVSADNARYAALEDFVKQRDAILDVLWNHPGQGMNLTFAFMSVTPKNGQPARLEYLGMGQLMGDFSRAGGFVGYSKQKAAEIRSLKDSPGLTVDDNIVRSLWIKPVRPKTEKEAGAKPVENVAAPTLVTTRVIFDESTRSLNTGDFLRYELSVFELLKRSVVSFAGYVSDYAGIRIQIPHALYQQLLAHFEGEVRRKLTAKLGRLNRKRDFYNERLRARLDEGMLSKIINRRGDVPLDPAMFNDSRAHLVSAAGTIANGALRHAADSLDQAEMLLSQHEAWLFRYDKGYFPAWSDSME